MEFMRSRKEINETYPQRQMKKRQWQHKSHGRKLSASQKD